MKIRTPIIQNVFLFIILFHFSSCSYNSVSKSEDQIEMEFALKHRIKSITEFKDAQFGSFEKEQISHWKTFDEKGLKKKEIGYSDGKIESVVTYEHDNQGNLICSNAIKSDSSFLFKATMNYYENNLRKELYFFLPDGTYKYRNIATYDNDGKMTELKYYWPDGLKAQNKYVYDGNNKIEDTEYAPDGQFRYKWKYKYDSDDNLTEAVQYYPGNRINGKINYEYDSNNLLIKQVNFFGESVQNVISFEYNSQKLLSLKTETTYFGIVSSKYKYQYEFY